jgi:ABC-type Na+ efflux pump permease subunit
MGGGATTVNNGMGGTFAGHSYVSTFVFFLLLSFIFFLPFLSASLCYLIFHLEERTRRVEIR